MKTRRSRLDPGPTVFHTCLPKQTQSLDDEKENVPPIPVDNNTYFPILFLTVKNKFLFVCKFQNAQFNFVNIIGIPHLEDFQLNAKVR